jgi:hypothetical protein
MKAYVCTYRHFAPPPLDRKRTEDAARKDPLLDKFLQGYDNSFFDWGDDPSFFAAHELLGDVRKASWGVCRPDVRKNLQENDLVVFFCGRHDKAERLWRYYFIGFGTIQARVERADLWKSIAYKPYRSFYNVLARLAGNELVPSEKFHPYHKVNFASRAKSPYLIFNAAQSSFNLNSPHHVATWHSDEPVPEIWKTDTRSKRIERLLFTDLEIVRRLRTARSGYGHAKLNLVTKGRIISPELSISKLKRALSQLV